MKHFYIFAAMVLVEYQFQSRDGMFCLILSKFYYQAYCSQSFSTKILTKSEIVTYYSRQETLVVSHCQCQSGVFKVNFWQIFTVYRALGQFLAVKVSRNETFLQFCCHGGSCTAMLYSRRYVFGKF